MSCVNCNCSNNAEYSRGTYKGSISVGTTDAFVTIKASACALRNKQLFRVYIPSNDGTTQPLYLVACNGVQAPLFLESTGAQATAAALIATVTYLISYDDFSGKFFVVGA